jgi:hypothetical protein
MTAREMSLSEQAGGLVFLFLALVEREAGCQTHHYFQRWGKLLCVLAPRETSSAQADLPRFLYAGGKNETQKCTLVEDTQLCINQSVYWVACYNVGFNRPDYLHSGGVWWLWECTVIAGVSGESFL